MTAPEPEVVLIVPTVCRYQWNRPLQQVEVVPFGKQAPLETLALTLPHNTRRGALRAAARHIVKMTNRPAPQEASP